MKLFVILVLSAFYVGAESASLSTGNVDKSPCCLPDEWEGSISETAGTAFKEIVNGAINIGSIHVDARNMKVTTNTSTRTGGIRNNMVIYRNKTVTFVVEPKQQKCIKLNQPLVINNCIPKNATYEGTRMFGDDKASVLADVWSVHEVIGGMNIYAEVATTQERCFPITQTNIGGNTEFKFIKFEQFFNMKTGIKDPNVFSPPDYCNKARVDILDNLFLGFKHV